MEIPLEANAGKVECALQEAALMSKEEDEYIEELKKFNLVFELLPIKRKELKLF